MTYFHHAQQVPFFAFQFCQFLMQKREEEQSFLIVQLQNITPPRKWFRPESNRKPMYKLTRAHYFSN